MSKYEAIHPTETTVPRIGGDTETEIVHPAFGKVTVNRVAVGGKGMRLFGTDFGHHNILRVTVHTARARRSLSRYWVSEEKQILSFMMSEAQWAAFVSSMNSGTGSQCTFETIAGEYVPGIHEPVDTVNRFKDEVKETMNDCVRKLEALRPGLTKAKREELDSAIMEIRANLPFVVDSFDEHVEERTVKAKVELDAYFTGEVVRRGLEAIGGRPIAQIEDNS